ncbi:hypothetical protein QYM36_008039 [Artemia franciscana]|uniref:XK-related protein n=1 Tax=Artemia franciscana TaxID=6661 RepID=A0AA88LHP1_ARTSF|nr:hypothetical protein QYM36_008039 [Artemia franciscana]
MCIVFIQSYSYHRYLDIVYYGLKSRKSRVQRMNIQGLYCPWPKRKKELEQQVDYFNLLLHAERDASMLNLMQSFIQDAPQLVLQIYILAVRPPSLEGEQLQRAFIVLVQVASAVISLGSLSLALTSYQRILRYAMLDKPNLSFGGQIFYFLWQSCAIASRVIALALFATQFKLVVFIGVGVHWAVMTLWIILQRTLICVSEDGKKKPCAEFLFNIIMGWVYVFCVINLKSSPGRLKYITYYIIYGAENISMIVLWFFQVYSLESRSWYILPSIISVPILFFLGVTSMAIYYNVYHPDRHMPPHPSRPELF